MWKSAVKGFKKHSYNIITHGGLLQRLFGKSAVKEPFKNLTKEAF